MASEQCDDWAPAGLSPAEADALAWEALEETARRRHCAGAQALAAFARGAEGDATARGEERTNVIDQGARRTYALAPPALAALFRALEACRLEGTAAHWSERQGTVAAPLSGLMLDFDVATPREGAALAEGAAKRLCSALVSYLRRDVDFAALAPRGEARVHVFVTAKARAAPLPPRPGAPPGAPPRWKYGFHVLVPGLRLPRAYKRALLREFGSLPAVQGVLGELGAEDPATCLDPNSASVPVLFFGSCKRGGVPYTLAAAYAYTFEPLGEDGATATRLDEADLRGANLAAELSLVAEATYEDGRPPLVPKRDAPLTAAAEARARAATAAADAGASGAEERAAAGALAELTLADPEARRLHALLDLLPAEFGEDRARWRDVVFAIAATSPAYRPLAEWWSVRCRHRSRAAPRADELEPVWEAAVTRGGGGGRLTARSIAYWAREADPARYAEVAARAHYTRLMEFVYAHEGALEHAMVAEVLHAMLEGKFVVDFADRPGRGPSYCWYEFVTPGQPMRAGEVWKWRREAEPDSVHLYMGQTLSGVFTQVAEHLKERGERAGDDGAARYYKEVHKRFKRSFASLYNDTFKSCVVRQANYLFRRRGFAEELDALPGAFGVANGVLLLGARCELVAGFHEMPVSRYSPVAYARFDPAERWTALLLGAIADIFPEADARDYILFVAAAGLYSGVKETVMLLVEGGGQNGKTSFLRWVTRALGWRAEKFNIQLLACDREDADRPNSAMMRFKHLNFAYAEEANRAQVLNPARLKELVNAGEVSGRDLHKAQETFTVHANVVVASQYSFIVNTTDHGTWRRIRHYTAKTAFRRCPDPASRFEKREDSRFQTEFPERPEFQTAMLSILVHYYERLVSEFGGEIKNVPAPTIDRETEAYRVSQDSLHRWICERVVASPDAPDVSLAAAAAAYTAWYAARVDRARVHPPAETIKMIANSALGKYVFKTLSNAEVLRGVRVADAAEELDALAPGETFVSCVAGAAELAAPHWGGGELADGLPWWAARAPAAGESARSEAAPDEWADSPDASAAVTRAGAAAARAARAPEGGSSDDRLAALIEGLAAEAAAPEAAAPDEGSPGAGGAGLAGLGGAELAALFYGA